MLLTLIGLDFSRGVKKPQAGVKITLQNMPLTFIGLTPGHNEELLQKKVQDKYRVDAL